MEDEITTVEEFAQAMAGEQEPQEVENAQPDEEAQSDDQPEAEQTEEEQETAESEESEGDQPEEPESLDDRVVEWETSAGDKFSVPVSELKQGFMRAQDYTHKTQELSRDRETFQQQIQQKFQEVDGYAQEIGALHAANVELAHFQQMAQQIDPNVDPIGYNTAVNQYLLAQSRVAGLANRVQQVQQQRTYEQQQTFAAAQKQAFETLSGSEGIPGFGKELLQKLNTTGHAYGFTDADLGSIADARMIKVLHDAMKWREAQAKKPEALNKVKSAPQKPAKQSASKPPSAIEKDLKQFDAKKDIRSYAKLLEHTM